MTNFLLYIWVWLGRKLGFDYIDIYSPGKGKNPDVKAVTFSREEWYIDKVSDIERRKNG